MFDNRKNIKTIQRTYIKMNACDGFVIYLSVMFDYHRQNIWLNKFKVDISFKLCYGYVGIIYCILCVQIKKSTIIIIIIMILINIYYNVRKLRKLLTNICYWTFRINYNNYNNVFFTLLLYYFWVENNVLVLLTSLELRTCI